MSLIADPDHLIHSLRLAYLKRIDDHYGPRVITFPSVTNANRPTTSTAIGQGDATTASISTALRSAYTVHEHAATYSLLIHIQQAFNFPNAGEEHMDEYLYPGTVFAHSSDVGSDK